MQTIIKKSSINAESIYDYKKIQYAQKGFLPCQVTEEKETLTIDYQTADMDSYTEIKSYSRQDRLRALLDIGRLLSARMEYRFSLAPDNLFFDRNFRVYVMHRDIWGRGEEPQPDAAKEAFLIEYKALIGFTLQKKYGYEDYLEGGLDLLIKNPFLKKIYHAESMEAVEKLLGEEYATILQDIRTNKKLVRKNSYRQRGICILISVAVLIAAGIYIGYYSLLERPLLTAKLQAENAFLRGDYIQVIDILSVVGLNRLEYEQKYILSNAYVSMESLTAQQKENILSKLSLNGDEKLMEYWIYIGRLNPVEAENIAMQQSDDELLLYAYMLEKDLTETDTVMTGEEKAAKLDELETKISKLAEQYLEEE